MITLHLLRHGETIWHRDNRYAGWSDIPLTDLGLEQARALAGWGRRSSIAAVVTSDLARAVVTGQELASGAGVHPRTDARLREVGFGRGEGLTRGEMREQFPDELAAFLERPATRSLPEGESGEQALQRARGAVIDLLQAVPDESEVAVVGHGTVIRLLLCDALGIALDDYRRRFPSIGNATLSTLSLPRAAAPAQLTGAGSLLRFDCPVR